MAYRDYRYPLVGGAYRWHIQQKCQIAIGRQPIALMDTDKHTVIRFDPPLEDAEKPLVDQIFSDPSSVCDPPELPKGETYVIKDVYDSDFKEVLSEKLGCDVVFWFPKSKSEMKNADRIALTFSKPLSDQDKKMIEESFMDLIIGWQ